MNLEPENLSDPGRWILFWRYTEYRIFSEAIVLHLESSWTILILASISCLWVRRSNRASL